MFREWLTQMLIQASGCQICGETDNVHEAQAIIKATRPDIVIADITLKGGCGLELIKNLQAAGLGEIPVLVLSMHEEGVYAERVLHAGARGYIAKHEASLTLLKAIRQVLNGELYLSEKLAKSLIKENHGTRVAESDRGVSVLTDRELEVFQLLGKGRSSHEIARLLRLAETTVDTYRARIKEKLGLRNAAELYSRAAQWNQAHGV